MARHRLNRDENGVPILNENDIEELTEQFLEYVAPECLSQPLFTPLAAIVNKLQSEGRIEFDGNARLGRNAKKHWVMGQYDPRRKRISIDGRLAHSDPRYSFTLAHELGHFYLHSSIRPAAIGAQDDPTIVDSRADLVTYRVEQARPRSIVEWQANRFAAGLLVPRRTLPLALKEKQAALGVAKQLGSIWLDHQPQNQRDYRSIVAHLALTYQCSAAVIRLRLEERALVARAYTGQTPTRIGTTLFEVLGEVFAGPEPEVEAL